MKINFNASKIRSVIEQEAIQSDHFDQASQRNTKEIIYVDKELDRLIKTEELYERRHKNFNLKQNIAARKSYAHKTFILTCVCLGVTNFCCYFFNWVRKIHFLSLLEISSFRQGYNYLDYIYNS